MKTLKRFMMLVAVAATALTTSCAKDAAESPETAERMVTMTINASDKIVDMNSDTRTYIENGVVKWSATGEGLAVVETNATATAHANTSKYTLGSDGKASFEVSFLPLIGTTELHYSAVYPTDAFVSNNTAIDAIKVNLPQVQHPTASSYDPQADLLIAKRVTRVSQPSLTEPLNFAFGRVISFGHMSVKNLTLTADELIKSVTVTVPNKVITGRGKVNLATGQALPDQWGYGNGNLPSTTPTKYAFDNVTMEYTTPFAAAAFEAWFTCAPFELSATESFTVTVMTNKKIYTKTVTPGKVFAFTMGNSTSFGLNMNGVAGVDRVPDVTTDYATALEQTTATLPGSYITNDCTVSEVGFIYSTTTGTPEEMLISGQKVTCATSTTPFSYNLTGLTAGTKYYYCAYVNADGNKVAYGLVLPFETKPAGGPVEYNETFENYHPSDTKTYTDSGTFLGVTEGTPTWTYVGCGNPTQAKTDRTTLQSNVTVTNATYISIGKNTGTSTTIISEVTVTIPGGITSLKFNCLTKTAGKVTITVDGKEIKNQVLANDTKATVEITNIDCNGKDAVIAFSNTTTKNRITIGDVRWTK